MNTAVHGVRPPDTLEAWQQALAEVPQTPALTGELAYRRADLLGRFTEWYQRLRNRPRAERRRLQRRLGLSLAGIALLLAVNGAPAGASPAALITVTNGTSTIAAGDGCSLPEAIINANADDQPSATDCDAGSGAGHHHPGHECDPDGGEQLHSGGANGLPVMTSAITIEGNGQTASAADRLA